MSTFNSLVLTQKKEKNLTKLQKQFNAYIIKINELKEQLIKNEEQLLVIHTRIKTEIIPLQQKVNDKVGELVYVFDKHYDDSYFKKKEKEKIKDYIMSKVEDLIEMAGKDEFKVLYEKYFDGESYDNAVVEDEILRKESLKEMVSSVFGIELDESEIDLNDPEQVQEFIDKKMDEQFTFRQTKKTEKPKSQKQIDKEEKIKQEAKNISKAARSIYTDLVKAFHPDREQDENERNRKTEIMKQITQAYEKDDLFELLRLKISLQNTDADSLKIADAELKYYNKILKEQVNELETRIWQQTYNALSPNGGYNMFAKFGGEPRVMKTRFTKEINHIKQSIKIMDENIANLKVKENMRAFLKNYQIQEEEYFWEWGE